MALPKLNLRDLFWLIVIVAMGVAWLLDRQLLQSQIDELNEPSLANALREAQREMAEHPVRNVIVLGE